MLVIELGKYVVTSQLQSKGSIEQLHKQLMAFKSRTPSSSEESLLDEPTRLKCYDRILVSGSNISLFFSHNGPGWIKSGYKVQRLSLLSLMAARTSD